MIGMDIGGAVHLLRAGKKVSRGGWNGKGMFLFIVQEWRYTDGKLDNLSNDPFVAMKTVDNRAVPWLCSQTDLLATDWFVVD